MSAEAAGDTEFERVRGMDDTPERTPGGASNGTPLEWVSPGVSLRKRILTGLGVALIAALFIFIALYENASMLVSTLIGLLFIGCFIWYLRIVAPTPYTLRLDDAGITRTERGGEAQTIAWPEIARIKEEVFKNGVSVSFALYKRVGERNVARAYVIYRDDIPRFEDFLAAVRARLPEETPWRRETIHE
jgi:hypothetical protein